MNLVQVAEEIQHRIIHIFGRDMEGKRAANGGNPKLDHDPNFRDYVWFYEVRLSSGALFWSSIDVEAVLPCGRREGFGCFSSDRLVSIAFVCYFGMCT